MGVTSAIDAFYKKDKRVYQQDTFNAAQDKNDGKEREKLLLFIVDSAHIHDIEITTKYMDEKLDLKEALSIAKTYLPKNMDDYKFYASGIELLDNNVSNHRIVYKNKKSADNYGVNVLTKANIVKSIEILGYVSNIDTIKEHFTDDWDYRF